jgi:hypothetical protein
MFLTVAQAIRTKPRMSDRSGLLPLSARLPVGTPLDIAGQRDRVSGARWCFGDFAGWSPGLSFYNADVA